MRAWLCVLALVGCDRVFGIGDPYEDARATGTGSDATIPIVDAPRGSDAPMGPTLLARFPFDNSYQNAAGSGAAMHDICARFAASGQFMEAVQIDGTCCITFDLTPPPTYTISFWAKAQVSTTTQLPLLVLPNYTGSPSDDWAFTGGTMQGVFYVETSTGTSNLGESVVDTSWHQYAVTFDGSKVQAYDDGSPGGSFTLGGGETLLYGPGTTVWIGCDGTTSGAKFSGFFDEVQIYNSALTAEQVAMLHNGPTL